MKCENLTTECCWISEIVILPLMLREVLVSSAKNILPKMKGGKSTPQTTPTSCQFYTEVAMTLEPASGSQCVHTQPVVVLKEPAEIKCTKAYKYVVTAYCSTIIKTISYSANVSFT